MQTILLRYITKRLAGARSVKMDYSALFYEKEKAEKSIEWLSPFHGLRNDSTGTWSSSWLTIFEKSVDSSRLSWGSIALSTSCPFSLRKRLMASAVKKEKTKKKNKDSNFVPLLGNGPGVYYYTHLGFCCCWRSSQPLNWCLLPQDQGRVSRREGKSHPRGSWCSRCP